VILSTHIVSDIEASAGHLAVMDKGSLRFDGTPEALVARAEGFAWDWVVPAERLADIRKSHVISSSLRRPDGIRVRIVGAKPSADAVAATPDLEDAYVALLGAAAH
jgi:ABC-2 type transport system ATP-binding protein